MHNILVARGCRFNELVSECVDETLSDLFGERAKQTVYTRLEKQYSITRDQIPQRLNDFSPALESMFGKSGRTIGKIFARTLYSKLGLEYVVKSDCEFKDYVHEARLSTLAILPE